MKFMLVTNPKSMMFILLLITKLTKLQYFLYMYVQISCTVKCYKVMYSLAFRIFILALM